MPVFWRLNKPRTSDYRAVFVNGEVRAEHQLPATGCRTCARLRSSYRVLPVDCPASWQGRPEVTPHPKREHRVRVAEFEQLRGELMPLLQPLPTSAAELQPGDRFQPLLLSVPSRPEADFLWPGAGDILVSERVKEAWEQRGFTGGVFSRVVLERVGKRSPRAKLRVGGGEPEDALRRIEAADPGNQSVQYFHLTITGMSGLPPGVDESSICPECERPDIPANDPRRRLVFEPGMWRGEDICILATTLYPVVTGRVKRALEDLGATNVAFAPASQEPE
jgi:hypothetical protein